MVGVLVAKRIHAIGTCAEHDVCGSPGLGGLRTAGLSPLAGLLDYEDTRFKTSFRVRMGLYLAWKAS